jgi:hypothetical protein
MSQRSLPVQYSRLFEPRVFHSGEALIVITCDDDQRPFVAGLVIHLPSGYCTTAAPILSRLCAGKHYKDIRALCRQRGWGWKCVYKTTDLYR